MATYQKDYNLPSLSEVSCVYTVNKFNDLNEVSAKALYTEILKDVKEVVLDDNIDCLMLLNKILSEIHEIKSEECLKNYQTSDGIGKFNLVSFACKNKAYKVLEYIFSEKLQTLYSLSAKLTGVHENGLLLSAMDEFHHNAFYYAIRSNTTDLLNTLVDKWQSQYSDEELDGLLSQSYKELKLRNVSLTKEMQLFVQSKILDLCFFHASTAGDSGTGISWDQIKKRIEMVVRYSQSIKNDYWDRDPEEKFIIIAEFIAKNIHVLKFFLKSTYDRLPWEEIEFCLVIFIRCCKSVSDPNLVYNCMLNKKQLLMHLFNFSILLDTEHDKFQNSDVTKLAKLVNLPRDYVVEKIIENNREFHELYDDFKKIRDFCSLEIIKKYTDLLESSDSSGERRCLIVSRVLQVMGEHLKNTLYSPKISTETANALLFYLSLGTKNIITKLRDSLSHKESLFFRAEIAKKTRLFKNIQTDILRIKSEIPQILYKMRNLSLKSLMKKVKLCDSAEDIRKCYGPYRHSFDLFSKEVGKDDLNTLISGDFARLKELLMCLDKQISDKTITEKILFDQLHDLFQEEEKFMKKINHAFRYDALSYFRLYDLIENNSEDLPLKVKNVHANLSSEATSGKIEQICEVVRELVKTVDSRAFTSNNKAVEEIIWKIMLLNFEMKSVKCIEEFRDIRCRNANRKSRHRKMRHKLSEKLLTLKLSQLKEVLIDFDLKDKFSSADCLFFENNMELRAVLEMLVLDILSISESSSSGNPFFLDSDLPILMGKNLRNHLAHGNTFIDACLQESFYQVLINSKKLLQKTISRNNNKMDIVIKCDYIVLEKSIQNDLSIISNQQRFFMALGEGNMTDIEESLSEGADVYGKDHNFSSCLHFAGKSPDIAILKWILKQGCDMNLKDRAGQTVLHVAAKFNRIEVIRYMVEEQQMSLDIRDVNGRTPLHIAVENQSNEVVEYISRNEICTTIRDKNSSTPLHTAIYRHNNVAAKILLEKEINVDENMTSSGYTFLHMAAKSGNLNMVKLLIAKKARIDSKSDLGLTALHAAAFTKRLEIAKALVENGADVNAKTEDGATPLIFYAARGSMEIVNFLMQHGADVNISDFRHFTPLMMAAQNGHTSVAEVLLQNGAFVNSKGNFGLTPLHFAAMEGHSEVVELLLNHKALVDCKNNEQETALHRSAHRGDKVIVELLLREGADINATESTKTTPLHAAAAAGYVDIVDLLIDEGADINLKNENGSTALHLAASNADRAVVVSLLKKGADIRASDANKETPIHILISRGLSDLLTPDGRDVNSADANGFTLLHLAAFSGDQILVEYCIENNCEVNARNNSGSTALHYAAVRNYPKIACLLLEKRAKIDAKDDDGCTPLLLAVRSNSCKTVEILVSHETNDFSEVVEDNIQAFEESVVYGYSDIVDTLLQNFNFDISNEIKQNALNFAIKANHSYVVTTLLERGFDINSDAKPLHAAVNNSHYDMVELLIAKGANPNLLDDNFLTPLDIAVRLGDPDMLEILLTETNGIRIKGKFISSITEYAVRKNQLKIIKLLVQMKIIDVNFKQSNGYTWLHTSALCGSLDVTRYLVVEGADINAKDEEDRKPVHIATANGFKDVVEFYLNCKNLGDETASLLLVAVSNGKANVCEILLRRYLDMNGFHKDDETLVNVALKMGHKDVLSVLLNYGACYNACSSKLLKLTKDNEAASLLRKAKKLFTAVGNNAPFEVENQLKEESSLKYCLANSKCVRKATVLHYASWKGYEEIVDILLKHNTNPNVPTKSGDTPLHYAVKFSHFRIVKSLLSYGAIYNALSQTGQTPLDYAIDREIRNFLMFLNNIFTKVQDKELSVLEDVRGKDEGTLRSVIRAKNFNGKTLIDVAYIYSFPEADELQMLFKSALVPELKSADNLSHQQKYSEAFIVLERELSQTVSIFGADSHPVLDVKENLAGIYHDSGNVEKALQLRREVCEIRKNRIGEDHLKIQTDEAWIAFFLSKLGKTQEAVQIFKSVRMKLKSKLKPDDLKMIEFENMFCSSLYEMHKFDEVLKISDEVEQIFAGKKEDEYRSVLASLRYIRALTLSKQQKLIEALNLLENIYDTTRNLFPPYHSIILETLSHIPKVLSQLGRLDKSLNKFQKVLKIQRSFLPENHIKILENEHWVGNVMRKQGKPIVALKILLSLESKLAVVAPDSDLMRANNKIVEVIKHELSVRGYQCVIDRIQSKVRKAEGNSQKDF